MFRSYLRFNRYLVNREARHSDSVADVIGHFLDSTGLAGPGLRYARMIISQSVELGYGESVAGISASPEAWETGSALPGGEHLPRGTYQPVLSALSQGLDIRTGEAATLVKHSETGVVVRTESKEYRGTHAVITVPLGVLKSGRIVFEPALPPEKQAAIDDLRMGTLEKVVMTFNDLWWSRRIGGSIMIASDDPHSISYIVDYSPLAPHPTLIGLCVGSAVPMKERPARMRRALEEALEESMPEPAAIRLTDWQHDPNSLGSYVVVPPGVPAGRIADLAAPVGEVLRFAGEHTSSRYSGYVHGAMLSGVREARSIIASV